MFDTPSPRSPSLRDNSDNSLPSLDSYSDVSVRFKHHKDFFFDDGNITFIVDDTQFKVHRFFFQRDSEYFRKTLKRSSCTLDTTVLDFERFLGVLYPRDFSKPTATTVDEWISILDLSTRWGFGSIRSLAIERLPLFASPIDKIVIGRKHNVTEWLMDAYCAICEREQSLTFEEGERLGMQEVINISRARQAVRVVEILACRSRLRSIIEKTFSLEVIPESTPAPSGVMDWADDQVCTEGRIDDTSCSLAESNVSGNKRSRKIKKKEYYT